MQGRAGRVQDGRQQEPKGEGQGSRLGTADSLTMEESLLSWRPPACITPCPMPQAEARGTGVFSPSEEDTRPPLKGHRSKALKVAEAPVCGPPFSLPRRRLLREGEAPGLSPSPSPLQPKWMLLWSQGLLSPLGNGAGGTRTVAFFCVSSEE